MKKIGIVTIIDNNNYGNRLQNYALERFLTQEGYNVVSYRNDSYSNEKYHFFLRNVKKIFTLDKENKQRKENFKEFNKYINITRKKITAYTKEIYCDKVIVGSDQVWNPSFGRLRDVDLLTFAKPEQRIAFSASFGINELPEEYKDKAKRELENFKAISVREDRGKKIVEELTGRKDIQVIVDPTMLLTVEEWDKVSKKPKQLNTDRYILNYFLGDLPEKRKKEIEKFAKENNCDMINILDKNSPFYECGPSEFLYLEKNAFLICTNSFHACIFSILYNRPFIVFNREGFCKNTNSRIDTILGKFNLENRRFSNTISTEQLNVNYEGVKDILKKEKEKARKFLRDAIEG